MKTTTMIVSDSTAEDTSSGGDVKRAPLSRQLADTAAESLAKASSDLVHLYKRVSLDHEALSEEERSDLLRRLAAAAGNAQSVLRPVAPAAVSVTDISQRGGHRESPVSPSHRR